MIVRFGLDGQGLAVEVPDPELARRVARLFPDYVVADADDATGSAPDAPPPRLVVRRADEGWRLEGDESLVEGGGPGEGEALLELLSRLEVALARGLLALGQGLTHLHAAGAALPGGGVLALGPAGAGKSSLALAWAVAGRPLLGDDVVLVDPEGRCRAFRRLVKVSTARLEAHGLGPDEEVFAAEGYEEAWIDPRDAGGWCREPISPAVVAFLRRGWEGEPRVEAVEPARALRLLLGSIFDTGATPAASVDRLARVLDRARAVRLFYRSSAEAAERLAGLAREAGAEREVERGGGG